MSNRKFLTNNTSGAKNRQMFEVVQTSTRTDMKGLKIGHRELEFGEKTRAFKTTDAGLAREIQQSAGQDGSQHVVVIPCDKPMDDGHLRTMLVPELPWHKEKENGGK